MNIEHLRQSFKKSKITYSSSGKDNPLTIKDLLDKLQEAQDEYGSNCPVGEINDLGIFRPFKRFFVSKGKTIPGNTNYENVIWLDT